MTTAVYVYAEHATLAGRVVAWDPKVKSEEELAEEKGEDIYHYAASEEDAIAQAREVLATPQTGPSHRHDAARCVLDHFGVEPDEDSIQYIAMGEPVTVVYVYAEGHARAGHVAPWNPARLNMQELAYGMGAKEMFRMIRAGLRGDVYAYAETEEGAIARARRVLATPQTGPSHKHDVARRVLEHFDEAEHDHEAPCCECGDRVTWDDEAERTGNGPWDESNEIWCQACWERVGMKQPEKETK